MCQNNEEEQGQRSLFLVRYDEVSEDSEEQSSAAKRVEIPLKNKPKSREELLKRFKLPRDSVVKLIALNDSGVSFHIPWSLLELCPRVEIQIWRKHQNFKPRNAEEVAKEEVIKKSISSLETRIASLEFDLDKNLDMKAERDLQLISKQVSFLKKMISEAEQMEWTRRALPSQ